MKYKNILIVIIATSTLGLLFQNCQDVAFKSADAGGSSTLSSSRTSMLSSSVESSTEDSSTVQSNSGSGAVLKADHVSSMQTQSDCSQSGSTITLTISNAGSDILVCQEYTLDLPAGHPRRGESFTCQDKDFVKPPMSWIYSHSSSQWTAKEIVNNSNYLVPGSYKVAVKDNQGKIYRSTTAVIKRSGYANCIASASVPSVSVKQCSWSGGIVIGPTPNYANATNQVCRVGNETYRHVDSSGNVHNYSCICQ
ncbi:MAG: hypothetical protein JNL11_01820 [Bdellovibrionaceae bacterium]|nr:hypothetical protein [Pseudobdellovibrionaceae bacterium]